ncbi:MAG: phosphoribosylglycinamide formyltransferase [Candidatus Brocadia sp. AMX2]|uniref:Phosphoribosylglycinamide formyltransferase n=1 Tax=Candidatus Brocadia sinica JPN1 TaxID=1197129 RepID=A0ABQ0JZ64_9BACT|nr:MULTISPECIES: phosphoribosylglycinamide formyltransferase [Brocadia]MBC6931201.1 phosphoribosylglycinamide formyltransferase [Candidatus Brocadia sp.]MBL1168628.1 phosphoribosylglycinamide formyltransferase [Candidatus Brocadia sp. AMX1]MCK6467283.1 phosphoribosylglycinamide formyltransferase [Candidatus Brocadia sinica]NOG40166.1 phosphoribosylglycinamide formyltransferase [Planctomycetota bacterium]KAA0246108.1 MAG: phosphoribosylglycinamide formyltransferase [Candidatus Brocadia sp. AMX2
MIKKIRLGVLISGGGNTLQNFIDQIEAGKLPATIQIVISSKPNAAGLDRARKHNLCAAIIPYSDYNDIEAFSHAITNELDKHPIDLVVLAGFVHFYKIPEQYKGRVMNIHPGLIPAFCGHNYYGKKVHEAVINYGAKVSGCTVHFADNVYDNGPVIIQRAVPVLEDDTPDTLAARVFKEECEAYPEAIRLFAEGRLKIEGRKVRILNPSETSCL